jgi:CubicO group peptidase (beta-lactamase class C family)
MNKLNVSLSSIVFCITVGMVAAGSACTPPVEVDQKRRLEEFEKTLQRLAEELQLPGMAAGIVRDQELWWFRGFGYADLENRTPVTRDTPYHLASLTKTFASTILLQLVEQGKLDLDTPISEFGIDLESPGTITVRHIFSHTSHGNPGEDYRYNGSLFGGGLGKVIEDVTGRSFEDELMDNIVRPLGLKNTGRLTANLKKSVAKPYLRNDAGELELAEYPITFSPSAGMVSTIADYAAYDAAMDEHRFLRPETQAEAFSPQVSTLGHELPYGLGWFSQEFAGVRMIWHYGQWASTSTLVLKIPEKNITFLAFANADHLSRGFGLGGGDVLDSPLAIAFLRTFVLDDSLKNSRRNMDW